MHYGCSFRDYFPSEIKIESGIKSAQFGCGSLLHRSCSTPNAVPYDGDCRDLFGLNLNQVIFNILQNIFSRDTAVQRRRSLFS